MAASFQVITYGWDRHAGMQHDAGLLHQALLQVGHPASIVKRQSYRTLSWRVIMSRKARGVGADRVVRGALGALSSAQRVINPRSPRVAVHMQYASPRHLITGARQVFVPNPEWFWDRDAWALPLIDVVMCKTRHAVQIF